MVGAAFDHLDGRPLAVGNGFVAFEQLCPGMAPAQTLDQFQGKDAASALTAIRAAVQ